MNDNDIERIIAIINKNNQIRVLTNLWGLSHAEVLFGAPLCYRGTLLHPFINRPARCVRLGTFRNNLERECSALNTS